MSEFFLWVYCRKSSKNRFPNLCRLFQKLFIWLHEQKKLSGLGDTHWIAWRSSWEHFRVRSIVDRLFGHCTLKMQNSFCQLFIIFAIIYYDSHYLESSLERVSPNNPQHLLSAHMTSGLQKKFFSWVFWEYFSRKHGFLGRFFVSGSVFFFTEHLVVNFWNLPALRLHFTHTGCLPLTFDMTIFFSKLIFFLNLGQLPWTSAVILWLFSS